MSGINGIGAQQTPSSGAAYDAKRVRREAGGGNAGALREKGTGGDSVNFSSEAKQAGKGVFSESAGSNLSPEEQAQVQELKKLDQQVRQHEAAHMAAAGGYARGGANYSYTTGPDGRRYATGGEVSIDVSAERTPEATIQKMQVVKQAALAPANPSPQDRAVYAAASRAESAARQDLAKKDNEEGGGVAAPGSANSAREAGGEEKENGDAKGVGAGSPLSVMSAGNAYQDAIQESGRARSSIVDYRA